MALSTYRSVRAPYVYIYLLHISIRIVTTPYSPNFFFTTSFLNVRLEINEHAVSAIDSGTYSTYRASTILYMHRILI
jgi:hypothetical protein